MAALWLSLALIAGLFSIWLRISTALSEIVVGTVAQLIFGAVIGSAVLGTDESWIKFLSGIGDVKRQFRPQHLKEAQDVVGGLGTMRTTRPRRSNSGPSTSEATASLAIASA